MIGKSIEETNEIIKGLKKRERIDFLIKNKTEILAQKKSGITKSMPISLSINSNSKVSKSEYIDVSSVGKIAVKAIGNLCMYMDSHLDVQGTDCWKKTLQESKSKVYHAKNHSSDTDGMIGKMSDVYAEDFSLKSLGLNSKIDKAQALVFESDVYKSLDEKTFTQYALGMINQHSVGMIYTKIELAVNDEDEKEEYRLWNKHIDNIINKEVAEKYGYFFYVAESKLIEISAVTRGSNDITPTLNVKEAVNDTSKSPEPSIDTQSKTASIDAKNILNLIKEKNE